MDKIKRFVECLIPVTACNLKCSYCYVIQRDNRKNKIADFKYTPEQIGEALNKERWGGICYFSICGAGETTLQKDIEEIVFNILNQGHYVNITTNGCIKKQIEKIIQRVKPCIKRLHFAFSFHYLELIRTNKLDEFFENINMVKASGASIMVQFNMCDEYLPYLNEMEKICIEKIGARPQIAATRKESSGLDKIELLTRYSKNQYVEFGEKFKSPLFNFTMKNFNIKRREFCYAGDWSAILDLSTGIMRRCYSSYIYQDIFKNPHEKIRFIAMGNCCGSPFCMNSSHFMSLGVIPQVKTPKYAELRNRKSAKWYSDDMNQFLSGKLNHSNKEYGVLKKIESNMIGCCDALIRTVYQKYKKIKNL
ncbi:radical SAM protein [Clostridium butyricum]|uniref:radical SAM protein n=1 Tax=Clostridium butyricum TaxID=1492 RepID=UPI001576018A|nr:radical SAM protein [Clostridium butyricum]